MMNDITIASVNEKQMAGIQKVAEERGRALGISSSDVLADIMTGITYMSPIILDKVGIPTGGEQALTQYAASLGKRFDDLTDTEVRQFYVNCVLNTRIVVNKGQTLGPSIPGIWAEGN